MDLREHLQMQLTDYTIERELGGGGMSRVFVAMEKSLGRRVVIKVLSTELAASLSTERFKREIVLAASLQQANIVPVLSAGEIEGTPYYTMPYIEGASLRVRLDAGSIRVAEALTILRDVAKALAYAHDRGVVHRDIKPENVLLTGGSAVVTDFGIAKALEGSAIDHGGADAPISLGQLGIPLGTPAYMAPEQILADPEIDHHADLYSLGIVAYEMLAGRHPFAGLRAHELLAAHLKNTPAPLESLRPDVPPALAALVAHMLRKRPDERPEGAAEVLERLDCIAASDGGMRTSVRVHASPPVDRGREPGRRRRLYAAAAVVVLAVTVAGASRALVSPAPTDGGPGVTEGTPPTGVAPRGIKSVAVLPFVNVGGNARDEYFSDGMTDELMGTLGKIKGLRVAGRSSAFSFKGKARDAREAGARLRVAAVLEGSIRRDGPESRCNSAAIQSTLLR